MKVGIGQDSHKFDFNNSTKTLILGGVKIPNEYPLLGNSDADVILHSITNAISSITCVNVLGTIADDMCKNGITDSSKYLEKALSYLKPNWSISHVSISIECKTPKITPYIDSIRNALSNILNVPKDSIGITATTGEGLTDFGRGLGIQAFSCVTVIQKT